MVAATGSATVVTSACGGLLALDQGDDQRMTAVLDDLLRVQRLRLKPRPCPAPRSGH